MAHSQHRGYILLLHGIGILALILVSSGCEQHMGQTQGVLIETQSNIKKLSAPVQCSEYTLLAGDPCVMKDANLYRIFYTGLDKEIMGGGIGSAVSPNVMNWTVAEGHFPEAGKGIVLRGVPNSWQHQLETAAVVKHEGNYFMYYCGYPKVGWPENPGQLGVAISHDGVTFERPSNEPILVISPDGYDPNGLYSPSVIHDDTQFVMVYAGHCYDDNYNGHKNRWRSIASKTPPGFYLLCATSSDGINWIKRRNPVLSPSQNAKWMMNGVAEPDLIKAPDGKYYLFFTGNLGDDETRLIAVAQGDTALGPWRVRREPLLTGTPGLFDSKGVLAPSVLIEGDTLRLWYLTSDGDRHMTGYAEMPWPPGDWSFPQDFLKEEESGANKFASPDPKPPGGSDR